MVLLIFISLFTATWQQPKSTREVCPFDVVCGLLQQSGSNFSCGWAELLNLLTLINKQHQKDFLAHFSMMVGQLFVCVKFAGVRLNVCECTEKGRELFWKTGVNTAVVCQRYCREGDFSGWQAPPVFMLVGMCVTWIHSRGNNREQVCGYNSLAWT